MDWKKLGVFKNLNRFDVWQHIFSFLDIKSVINHISKTCKSFKYLCLLNISHIKSICILSISIDSVSAFCSLMELLKCEKTFLLKVSSNWKLTDLTNISNSVQRPLGALRGCEYTNKSVVRLKYKSKNGNFGLLGPLIRSLSGFSYFTISGNSQLPVLSDQVARDFLMELGERKINYFKISKITMTTPVFKSVKKYVKEKTPMVIILDVNCFYEKASNLQGYLAELWKSKWLLNIDYKLNGKTLISCTREFLTY